MTIQFQLGLHPAAYRLSESISVTSLSSLFNRWLTVCEPGQACDLQQARSSTDMTFLPAASAENTDQLCADITDQLC